jgi:hypothetical protein
MVREGLHYGLVRRPGSEQASIKGEGFSLYMLLRISKDRRFDKHTLRSYRSI